MQVGEYVVVKESAGRGRGMFAVSDAVAGTTLFTERAVIAFDPLMVTVEAMARAVASCPKLDELVHPEPIDSDESPRPRCDADVRRLMCNAFAHAASDESATETSHIVAVYQNISMINHSCAPNVIIETDATQVAPNEISVVSRIVAAATVTCGQELFLCYRRIYAPTEIRRRYFERNYGFTCTCELCCECSIDPTREEFLLGMSDCASPPAVARAEKLFAFIDPLDLTLDLTLGTSRSFRNEIGAEHIAIAWKFAKMSWAHAHWKLHALRGLILQLALKDASATETLLTEEALIDEQPAVAMQRMLAEHASALERRVSVGHDRLTADRVDVDLAMFRRALLALGK